LTTLGALAVLVLSGCVAAGEPSSAESSLSGATEMPKFTGPFAAEYEEAWQKNETASVRTTLEDGRISDQEWSQVITTLTTCLSDHGITLVKYNEEDGSYESNVGDANGDVVNESMGECEQESGEAWIGRLYRGQTNNPNNIPETQLLTDCLIRNRAVPETYTVEQYLADAPNMNFPYIDDHGGEIFDECNRDMVFVR